MKHREPLDLKGILIVYNFSMVGLSGYMFYEFLVTSWLSNYSYLCQPVDYSNSPLAVRMAKVCWWFFFSKVIELGDTLFFILRKKNSQLTFLHIYHHATMVFNWWSGVKYLAGGQSFFIGLVNTFVHVVMYSYYGLAAIGPHMQKYLWWKRYLTSLQLVQFVLFLLHTGYNLFADCDFPDSMNMVVFGYCVTLIVLFNGLCVAKRPVCSPEDGGTWREPLDLKGILIVYNFSMVGLSGYMFYEFLVTSWLSNYSYLCQPVDYSNSPLAVRMARACWWFFFSKVIELSDTLFFILRKKNRQLTFLHIFHHGPLMFNWWAGIKFVAGGQSFFIGLLNTFVHVVMYSYYGLAAIGPHMQKYLWWKRYLTSLQLVQFVLFLLHSGYNLFADCDFPDSMNALVFGYCVSLMILFLNFYYQSYVNKRKQT
ncbi:hypothetical protein F7725_027463 [Dissostichus mawsoni]|uniref:Elongation of very long chain fatty acids protein n=1 Tax=Dissostichus mawsoni TaxID=36200 RepID=A0A7J5XCZ6_DISMA|nr:hypothetical protein F7725_027463 [Dissostichus mawsoni]